MTVPTIHARVRNTLDDPDTSAFITGDYLARLYDNLTVFTTRRNRFVSRVALLCVVYVVIATASVSKVSFGGLEITDLSLIAKAIPPIVAFTAVRFCASAISADIVARVADSIVSLRYPTVAASGLTGIPGLRTTLGLERLLADWTKSRWTSGRLSLATPVIGSMTFYGFEVYATIKNFTLFGSHDPLMWVSLIVSAYLLIESGGLVSTYVRSPIPGLGRASA